MREKPKDFKNKVMQYIAVNGIHAAKLEFKGQVDYTTLRRWTMPNIIQKAKDRYIEQKKNPDTVKKMRLRDKQWRESKGKTYIKKYNQHNKEKINQYQKEWSRKNKDKSRQYSKKWADKNKEKIANKRKARYHNNILFKLMHINRVYMGQLIDRTKYLKIGSCREYLGAEPQQVKDHIEKQFLPGMCWENHGEWHIDHIIPLSSAKTETELKKLFHYTNLQPLWKIDNLKKNNKI